MVFTGSQLSPVIYSLSINSILASVLWPLTPTVPRFANPGRMSQSDLRDLCEDGLRGVKARVTPAGGSELGSMPRTLLMTFSPAPAFVFYLGAAVFRVHLNLWLPWSPRAVGSFLNIFSISDVRPTSGHSFSLGKER